MKLPLAAFRRRVGVPKRDSSSELSPMSLAHRDGSLSDSVSEFSDALEELRNSVAISSKLVSMLTKH
jgi:hypothetical protein